MSERQFSKRAGVPQSQRVSVSGSGRMMCCGLDRNIAEATKQDLRKSNTAIKLVICTPFWTVASGLLVSPNHNHFVK